MSLQLDSDGLCRRLLFDVLEEAVSHSGVGYTSFLDERSAHERLLQV